MKPYSFLRTVVVICVAFNTIATAAAQQTQENQETLGDVARRARAQRETKKAAEGQPAASENNSTPSPNSETTSSAAIALPAPPTNPVANDAPKKTDAAAAAQTPQPSAMSAPQSSPTAPNAPADWGRALQATSATPTNQQAGPAAIPAAASSHDAEAVSADIVLQLALRGQELQQRFCSEGILCVKVVSGDTEDVARHLYGDDAIAQRLSKAGVKTVSVRNNTDNKALDLRYAMSSTSRGWAPYLDFLHIDNRSEYMAMMFAENTKDPVRRLALFQEYLRKFPNSEERPQVLDRILIAQMQLKDRQGGEATAKQILAATTANDPQRLRAYKWLVSDNVELARSGVHAERALGTAREYSKDGLAALAQATRSPSWSDDQFSNWKSALQTYFQSVLNANPSSTQGSTPRQENYAKTVLPSHLADVPSSADGQNGGECPKTGETLSEQGEALSCPGDKCYCKRWAKNRKCMSPFTGPEYCPTLLLHAHDWGKEHGRPEETGGITEQEVQAARDELREDKERTARANYLNTYRCTPSDPRTAKERDSDPICISRREAEAEAARAREAREKTLAIQKALRDARFKKLNLRLGESQEEVKKSLWANGFRTTQTNQDIGDGSVRVVGKGDVWTCDGGWAKAPYNYLFAVECLANDRDGKPLRLMFAMKKRVRHPDTQEIYEVRVNRLIVIDYNNFEFHVEAPMR